jgi:hypothetical protein
MDFLNIQHLRLSQRSARITDIAFDKPDLFISFVSWEERSVAVAKSSVLAAKNVVFRFAGPVGDELKDKREREMQVALSSRGASVQRVLGAPSTQCAENFDKLATIVRLAVQEQRRPINLLLDISCCPKSFLTFLLGYCLANGFVRTIQFFYAHTKYENKVDADPQGEQVMFRFTDGEWSALQVPFLEGTYRPSAPRKLVVMMGAEIATTESFLRRYQPDKLELVAPRPGVTKQIDDAVDRGVHTLMNRFEIPDSGLKLVGPHDAVGSATACREYMDQDSGMDVSLVCLGTKPHAIGAAVIASTDSKATLVCRVPKYYSQSPGQPTGEASIYQIEDLSAF